MVIAIGFAKDQIEIRVVGGEEAAVLLLLLPLEPQRGECGLG